MSRSTTTRRPARRVQDDRGLRARLAGLESLYETGQYAEAIRAGESMRDLPDSTAARGRVHLCLAQANLQLGKPDRAKGLLAEAMRDFDAVGDATGIVEGMSLEASIACVEQRPDALELASGALSACRSLRDHPITLEVQILSSLASSQLLVGLTSEAIATYDEAIERADPVVDMRRLGKLLGNAGIAYGNAGQLDKAIRCSTRAVNLFETLQDLVSLAREENNLGCYLIQRRELRSARRHLERSLKLFDETDLRTARGSLLLSLCELCFAEDDADQARAYADLAIQAGEAQSETWSVANARMWKGRIAARLGNDAVADGEFQMAATTLEKAGMRERLISCCTAYADVLERRGDMAGAYTQLKRAFRVREPRRENGLSVDEGV